METRFFFTSFFEIRKFVKTFMGKVFTLQREREHNFCFRGEIFTPARAKKNPYFWILSKDIMVLNELYCKCVCGD